MASEIRSGACAEPGCVLLHRVAPAEVGGRIVFIEAEPGVAARADGATLGTAGVAVLNDGRMGR